MGSKIPENLHKEVNRTLSITLQGNRQKEKYEIDFFFLLNLKDQKAEGCGLSVRGRKLSNFWTFSDSLDHILVSDYDEHVHIVEDLLSRGLQLSPIAKSTALSNWRKHFDKFKFLVWQQQEHTTT